MSSIVYTSDLHGNLDLYRAAGNAAVSTGADALIFGGDLCPGTPNGKSFTLPTEHPDFILHQVGPLVRKWKQAHGALRVFAIPGNDDCQTILPALDRLAADGLIENLHRQTRTLNGYTLTGLSFVPPTPFQLKDFDRWDHEPVDHDNSISMRGVISTPQGFEVIKDVHAYLDSSPSIAEELRRLPIPDPARTVAVIHTPPFDTHCDVLFDGRHIGSRSLRSWIETHQPRLTLHGHIHESPKLSRSYCDRIGSTVVVNPGCDHLRPYLVFIDLDKPTELEHSLYGKTVLS